MLSYTFLVHSVSDTLNMHVKEQSRHSCLQSMCFVRIVWLIVIAQW